MDALLGKLKSLDPVNREHLARYLRALHLKPNLRPRTIETKIWRVYTFLQAIGFKDAADVTREDVEEWILRRRDEVEPVTLQGEILEALLFYRWLAPDREKDLFPGKMKRVRHTLPVDRLLTRQDIMKLVGACTNHRDRALVMLMWDSGARIGEIIGLKLGDVTFDQYGAVVIVEGKTGRRRLRLTSSAPDLQAWINVHPHKENSEAPLFVTHRRYGSAVRPLNLHTVQTNFKALSRRAGLHRIHPHLIRHARLTDLAKSEGKRKGLNEMELRIVAGWERSSVMPAVYVHLSGGDVEDRILQNAGLLTDGREPDTTLEPVKCPRCQAINPPGALFCVKCSMALSEKAIVRLDRILGTVRASDDYQNLLAALKEDLNRPAAPIRRSS
jgi:integrase